MKTTMQLNINNEYDRLEAVLVHRPGPEIDRLTHENMHRFLFEDIPYLRRMQDEHDGFVAKMRKNKIEVVYLEDLLRDVLKDESTRRVLIENICETAAVPAIAQDLSALKHWNLDELIDLLFAGLTTDEYIDATGQRVTSSSQVRVYLLPPIPNAYFSRDPAVVVGDAAISSKMHYRERVRETILMRAVLENHPEFSGSRITYGGSDEPTEDRPYTIEGGDVIVLSSEAVLVGDSERTRSETIERLASKCFQLGQIKRIYEIPIPSERTFMHLDTVFTIIDRGVVLCYPEVISKLRRIHRYEPSPDDPTKTMRIADERDFPTILREEFDMELTVIETAGGEQPFAKREQRMDGANALAIAPRVAITYDRNERTTAALEAHGITCLGIDDSELVRGLGGPRCMTMPLRRAAK